MDRFAFLSNADVNVLDDLYQRYQQDPTSVEADWARFFEGFDFARARYGEPGGAADANALQKEIGALNLIHAYRSRGHLVANVNPLQAPQDHPEAKLSLEAFGLAEADLDQPFAAGAHVGLGAKATLRQIVDLMKATYCGTIGVEYKYIRDPEVTQWLEERMESSRNQPKLAAEDRKLIFQKLAQATLFEQFMQKKFVGQKRFSVEGNDTLIPCLEAAVRYGAEQGVRDVIFGMAHRGRLNVLTAILRMEYDEILAQFQGKNISNDVFDGDVKYHIGHDNDVQLAEGHTVRMTLAANPSHLEAVDPIVLGMARARMDLHHQGDASKVCPILMHGDAALAGQGVVYELLQMSRLRAYQAGGTLHIVTNNQLGFTTDPADARSSTYASDVAKITLSPVFHVNGDDPEALVHVTRLAMAFRQRFQRDVFIDLIGFRKYGHNEGDEPRFTQPKLYQAIDQHPTALALYKQRLLDEGAMTQEDIDAYEKEFKDHLNEEFEQSKTFEYDRSDTELKREWEGLTYYDDVNVEPNPDTTFALDKLTNLGNALTTLPESFTTHRMVGKVVERRRAMLDEGTALDWGLAETLAYGSLLVEGYPIRMSGQDCERGTFSHRHAVLTDNETAEKYMPLNHLAEGQAKMQIYNSLLSEYAVMGFEFGYASAAPRTLTVWEAQYGDFFNGAQIIIDQFISSSKSKWQQMNGLVLLLPHGYEGGGPEHSSARIERFLVLCAQNNMYVANPTTPANLFHLLRRQVKANSRRPAVVFTPKSLLRSDQCVSSLKDLAEGGFQEVIDDSQVNPKDVKRVVLTSGKLYYDLVAERQRASQTDTAIVRVEQYYPFPSAQLQAVVKRYGKTKTYVWAQEEPINMGAWPFMLRMVTQDPALASLKLTVVGRREAASPATGNAKDHEKQQAALVKQALDLAPEAELAPAK